MYALRRGVGGLSSGTRVQVLSVPTVEPVRVRTLTAIPRYQHRRWVDRDGTRHEESIELARTHVEAEVPMDYLVLLRPQSR